MVVVAAALLWLGVDWMLSNTKSGKVARRALCRHKFVKDEDFDPGCLNIEKVVCSKCGYVGVVAHDMKMIIPMDRHLEIMKEIQPDIDRLDKIIEDIEKEEEADEEVHTKD